MQFSESWLRSFVDPAWSSDELAHRLTMLGLEVERRHAAAPAFSGVVVARVLSTAPHPNADKLKVCEVDVGERTPLSIVCGAPNVAPDMTVPCARIGAVLPPDASKPDAKPFVIGASTLRGVASQGMLCSARELGLSQDHAGLMLLDSTLVPGSDLRAALDLDDQVIEIKLTPDKGHCLSLAGIAREVAAASGAAVHWPAVAPVESAIDDRRAITIEAPDLCGRFAGRVIRGVNAQSPTPGWMKVRLERSGVRSISALVDISNYVMLESGQPTHVFDLDRVEGGLAARWAREGETLKLLNGETVALDARTGVVADARGAVSIAGIMGGESTMVGDATRNVFVEAAFWFPDAVRGRARRYGLVTDAGHRFERGVDYSLNVGVIERITQLVVDLCGGEAGPIDDVVAALPARPPVTLRVSRARRIVGMPYTRGQCTDVFDRLGLQWRDGANADEIVVEPPSRRFDLEREEDLIEEVARITGYEQIPVRPPLGPLTMLPATEGRRSAHDLRRLLVTRGWQETVNYSFVDPAHDLALTGVEDPIRLLNPIQSQMSVMRTGLAASLIGVLVHNLKRRADRCVVFEIGRVFLRDASVGDTLSTVGGIDQPLRVGGLAYGPALPEQWGVKPTRTVDFFDLKAEVEALAAASGTLAFEPLRDHPALHPGRAARVHLDGRPVGVLGELHPRHRQAFELPQAPVLFELEVEPLLAAAMPVVAELARFPVVKRDLAFVVDRSVAAEAVRRAMSDAVKESAPELVQDVTLFDEYHGKGLLYNEKSLAFRIVLQDTSSTLQDERVDSVTANIVERVGVLGARLRA